MSTGSELTVSAPGRICLFGDHQDFLGLAVIAAAIDRQITIKGTPRDDQVIHIEMPDIDDSDSFNLQDTIPYRGQRDYLRSVVNVLRRQDICWPHGFDCTIRGTIPINAGVSSSSALVIAWTLFLLAASDRSKTPDSVEIARIGHASEVLEFNEPGGMMDHYTSSFGGIVYIDCHGDITIDRLSIDLHGFVLGDSLEPKDTMGILKQSKADAMSGWKLMKDHINHFDFRTVTLEKAEPFLDDLPKYERDKVYANLVNWDITCQAKILLTDHVFDSNRLGSLINQHHAMLRDGIGVSTPQIEKMISAAHNAGALGAKVNGSGGGGCMIAYAPGREEEVVEAINDAGGKAEKVNIVRGAHIA